MTKQKWVELGIKDWRIVRDLINNTDTPQKWMEIKLVLLKFIDIMDEATEVYNLENNMKDKE